ncbi:M20 family metallopeptidase [Brevibacillus daliensis]|uniref:M20 family metallopeptidase n=1 Tax=Brevibacillus daliensis TaxID=2892995 RepID=UPI001E548476|nr:M20 family metallopeptidase [Brevibacillus daliensis]
MTIYAYMEKELPFFLQLLKESVSIDSPSLNKEQSEKMITWYLETVEKVTGVKPRRILNQQYGDQLICEFGTGAKRILIAGHYDTVWPLGEAEKRPFTIEGEKAFGPGVYDMKAGVLQALFAIKALQHFNRLPSDKTIVLLLTGDEEIGSPSSRALLEEEAKKAEAAFILEPPMATNGALKTWRKGSAHFSVIAKGISAHAGVDHEKGVSAIEEMSYQIQALQKLTDYQVGTTVNVGLVHGGIARNVVADYAEAHIDVRIRTMEEAERITRSISNLRPVLAKAELIVTGGLSRPPMERTVMSEALFQKAYQIAKAELNLLLSEEGTGGVSDGNFIAACGVPTLDGLGASGDFAHSPKEFIWIPHISQRTTLLAKLIEEC